MTYPCCERYHFMVALNDAGFVSDDPVGDRTDDCVVPVRAAKGNSM